MLENIVISMVVFLFVVPLVWFFCNIFQISGSVKFQCWLCNKINETKDLKFGIHEKICRFCLMENKIEYKNKEEKIVFGKLTKKKNIYW